MCEMLGDIVMNAYERILKTIRKESEKASEGNPFRLAEMVSENSCEFGNDVLDEEDLWIPERLAGELEAGDTVLIAKINESEYAILDKVVK